MQLSITGRHMEVTPALKEYINKKVDKVGYFVDHIIEVKVTLSLERKIHHEVEVIVVCDGRTFTCNAETEDMYESVDKAFDKIERQVRKFKERIQERKNTPIAGVFYNEDDERSAHNFTNIKEVTPKPMTEHEAILQLSLNHHQFVIFNNGHPNKSFSNSIALKKKAKEDKYAIIKRESQQWIVQDVSIQDNKLVMHEKDTYDIQKLSPNDASNMLINSPDREFVIYNNSQQESLDIVYLRNDRTLGLISSALVE